MGRRDRKQDTIKKIAIGSSIAAVAGYVAGILTAPKSGKRTRGDIKNAADKTALEAEKDFKKLQIELGHLIDEAKSNGGKLNTKAREEADGLNRKSQKTAKKKSAKWLAPSAKVLQRTRIWKEPSQRPKKPLLTSVVF